MILDATRPASNDRIPQAFDELGAKLQGDLGSLYHVETGAVSKDERFLRVDAYLRRGWSEGLDVTLIWRGEPRIEVKLDHGSRFEDRTLAAFIIPFFILGLAFAVWLSLHTDLVPDDPEEEEAFLAVLAIPVLIAGGISGAAGYYLSRGISALFFRRGLKANEETSRRVAALVDSLIS